MTRMHSIVKRNGPRLEYGERAHRFRLDPGTVASVFSDPLYAELINTPEFQRLKHIRFLGAIDYIFRPNGKPLSVRHTRYDHSLGVGALAMRFADEVGWNSQTVRTFVAAALVHDIGHGPLSHSLEPVFKEAFGIDHHGATVASILGTAFHRTTLPGVLRKYSVEPDAIIEMLSSAEGKWAGFFLGKFNFDTLDAIPRCATYLQRDTLHAPPFSVLRASLFRTEETQFLLDAFWRLKDDVYSKLISGPIGILADRNAQDFMRAKLNTFTREQFFMTEPQLRRIHPRLFKALGQRRWDRIELVRRRFDVVSSAAGDENRYVVRKEKFTIDFTFRAHALSDAEGPNEPSLFDVPTTEDHQ